MCVPLYKKYLKIRRRTTWNTTKIAEKRPWSLFVQLLDKQLGKRYTSCFSRFISKQLT